MCKNHKDGTRYYWRGGWQIFKSPKETIYSLKIWSFKLMTQGTS